jgi:hypothetical protein
MAKTLAAHGPEILEAALLGLESQREKLDAQIAQVRSLLGRRNGRRASAEDRAEVPALATVGTAKRELSPEARKRIAAAQKKRWAAFRKNKK